MIEARNLQKSYGRVHALSGVSFDVPPGRVTGLLGANGAGKSTTIRIITGYTAPDAGWVRVGGVQASRDPIRVRQHIGYLPESAPTYGEMPVEALLSFRASLHGMRGKARKSAVDKAIDACVLQSVRRRRVGQLSKGYKQRVGLATAILHDPPVLVLDEPSNGLDPGQITETRSLIRRLAEGRTVLVSSHILPEIERTCDRVVILARGRLCAQGPLDELLARGEHELVCEARFPTEQSATEAARAVGAVEGVGAVLPREMDDGVVRWRVGFDPADIGEAELRRVLGAKLAAAGAEVRLLEREKASLETLFLKLMEHGPDAAPAGSAA
ncbi:MAG: ABC transporter ATP-binding protein [Phycisphaera sp.]|nr:MAG: ABC transporter ATP-binding protein [Phycisphaera sp.]